MEFKLIITKAHIIKSQGYHSVHSCPLALALKEVFPTKEISAGGTYARINTEVFYFNHEEWDSDQFSLMETQILYNGEVKPFEVVFSDFPKELAQQAKIPIL